ncbi:MAG: GspE/PulE family protein [Desulfobacterales bacterium]|jgi:general secretion pathway protein E|nr:GspE/PulE family protein [Desulfobacterales bacterium]
MQKNILDPFADKLVCRALIKHGQISRDQAKEIYQKKDRLWEMIEKNKAERLKNIPAGVKIINPTTIVDVIVALKLNRADNPSLELDEDAVFQSLALEWGQSYQKIDPLELDLNLVTTTIPRSFAMKHLMLPIGIKSGHLIVATSNPFNTEAITDIKRVCHMPVKTVVSSKTDIIRIIDEMFGFKRSIAQAEIYFTGPVVDLGNLEQYVRLKSIDELPANDQHIVNAVNHLLSYAFDQRASDIHIEPKRESLLVRMRIDGVLHTVYKLPKKVHSAIISRIKNLSRLDMAEKRRPQDGRIKTDKGDAEVEIRVSTVPVAFGEKVVMRIMDPQILFQDLEDLGFTKLDFERYNRMIQRPHGMVLVCGPTGSGKSTTLYSTLRRLSTPQINITTIEDPIEMVHEEFNQIAVQPAVGVTFSTIIRNILRQDPDIIMVGELRDLDTAQNAIQAALTGHLVLSTLHTNDAPSAIIRLLDIGIPYFLVQAVLTGCVSQRLVRKICPKCIESYEIATEELRRMGLEIRMSGNVTLYRGKGCLQCRGTGYFGRTSVYEVLPYSKQLRKLTTLETDLMAITHQAKVEKLVSLRDNAIKKMLDGVTSLEDVLRVTWEHEEE